MCSILIGPRLFCLCSFLFSSKPWGDVLRPFRQSERDRIVDMLWSPSTFACARPYIAHAQKQSDRWSIKLVDTNYSMTKIQKKGSIAARRLR
jgi:hypothetical protein